MSRLAPDDICAFLINEARYLDERRWEDWLSLFADDGWYWVPIEEGQTDPRTTVSLMYDDRQLLETRVRRLKAGKLHAQSPMSRSTRPSQRDGRGRKRRPYYPFQVPDDRIPAQPAAAIRRHLLPAWPKTGNFVICWKKVEPGNCDSMMDGLNVPF